MGRERGRGREQCGKGRYVGMNLDLDASIGWSCDEVWRDDGFHLLGENGKVACFCIELVLKLF